MKSIIDDTLTLFDVVKNKFGYYITPIHYIALLDTDANWFAKWMVSFQKYFKKIFFFISSMFF